MSAADAQLKSIIDRVLRLKEEQDELAIEIREIYAEAKGNGYDKTALGQVVSHLRKVEKVGRDAVTERETMFDLYLTSYETGTTLATHTHEAKTGYAAQKGIDPKLAHTVVTGMRTETGRKALVAAVDIMIEREEHIDPETGEITESLADVPSDAVSERAATLVDASASAEAAIEGQPSVTAATRAKSAGEAVSADLPTNSETTPDPRPLTDADGHPRIPSSSPGCAKTNGLQSIGGQGRESENCITGNQEEHAVDQFTPPAFLAQKSMRDYRPHCQRPDACGASGLKHCYTCSKLVPSVGEVA